ncbi:MAG: RagB/SusD family nutrient uptake outer membrane protein [Chitinophagaceae bacterium]|nr:MAG: RagB/SusD family nutrient uptake outer membrane protein [Chitinophagaceae bacterium]
MKNLTKNLVQYTGVTMLILIIQLSACKKFLDEKSDARLVVPSTQQDLQALLDDYLRMNYTDIASVELSADDYYYTSTDWNALAVEPKALHVWQPENIYLPGANDWANPYKAIFVSNTVLEHIDKVEQQPLAEWNSIKGQAFYHRAKSYTVLLNAFAPAYHSATAATDLGLPIRATTNFNEPSARPPLAQNYETVIQDLATAIPLLPTRPVHVMRPSKPAAYGLLARTLLFMQRYSEALKYADSALAISNQLLDFNTLNANATWPIAMFNVEVLMENRFSNTALANSRAKIDSNLQRSYALNDLRRTVFFKNNNNGTYGFKGSYEGGSAFFSGIATDELYLIKAECLARNNDVAAAMETLNKLLIKRWKTALFVPLTAANSNEALDIILQERRKELLLRGLRWPDVKRLNKEGRNIGMTRRLNNLLYALPPNDPRFAIEIPGDIIQLTGMQQNPR